MVTLLDSVLHIKKGFHIYSTYDENTVVHMYEFNEITVRSFWKAFISEIDAFFIEDTFYTYA